MRQSLAPASYSDMNVTQTARSFNDQCSVFLWNIIFGHNPVAANHQVTRKNAYFLCIPFAVVLCLLLTISCPPVADGFSIEATSFGSIPSITNAQLARRLTMHVSCSSKSHEQPPGSANNGHNMTFLGRIVRLAVKPFHPQLSVPPNENYTTRKGRVSSLRVLYCGCEGDYNHFRTKALKNTSDRAVSILTTDCVSLLRRSGYEIRNGDLGENILLDCALYDDLKPDDILVIDNTTVSLRISEPMEPCANLCTLPTISNKAYMPSERINRCTSMLNVLNHAPGLRGWYAAVESEGSVPANATVFLVEGNSS